MFGADGPSFLTESLRSTSSGRGEESPGLGKKTKKGLGSGLFDDAGDDEDEEKGELFESTTRYISYTLSPDLTHSLQDRWWNHISIIMRT